MKETKKDIMVKAIKNYILEDLDEQERKETINELKRYKREFSLFMDYNWYSYGNILPYYYQIRDFYSENGCNAHKNDDIMLAEFKTYVREAIDEIIEENGGM